MMRLAGIAAVGVAALLLAGCGERPQVVNYKQGKYAGKPDTPAYQNAPYNGDKAAWERALATRAQAQNEYQRIK
jgi:hypothetical protein